MSCFYEQLKTLSVFVLGVQVILGVFRWIYENVIGPQFLEPTNLRQYGKWACKFPKNKTSDFIIPDDNNLVFGFCSGDRRYRRNWQAIRKISKRSDFILN